MPEVHIDTVVTRNCPLVYVVVTTGDDAACWGPFSDAIGAVTFAQFVTSEIDPAKAVRVRSPLAEMLSWFPTTKGVV
jgi:hypothetical protein